MKGVDSAFLGNRCCSNQYVGERASESFWPSLTTMAIARAVCLPEVNPMHPGRSITTSHNPRSESASSAYRRTCCFLALCAGTMAGCGGSAGNDGSGPTGTGGTNGGIVVTVPGAAGNVGSDGGRIIGVLPPDFTKAEAGG